MVSSLVSLPFSLGAALVRSTRMLAEAPSALGALTAIPDLAAAIDRLATVTEGGALDQLAATGESLGRLADAADALNELARATEALQALAEAADSLAQLAGASDALVQLSQTSTVLPALAASARNLPHMPDKLDALGDRVERTLARLEAVEPDLRQLAGTILQLDHSIAVLADALGPLQGTTERLGRIVDRLPTRRPAAS